MHFTRSLLAVALALSPASPRVAAAGEGTPEKLLSPSQRKPAPAFTLADVDGRTMSLAGLRGRIVLLDFWGIHCGGCNIELPWYVAFDAQYRAAGLSVLGLDMYGDSPEAIRSFALAKHIAYPLAVGSDELAARYNVTAMPVTLLLDRQGRIALAHTGVVDRATFDADIQQLLKE